MRFTRAGQTNPLSESKKVIYTVLFLLCVSIINKKFKENSLRKNNKREDFAGNHHQRGTTSNKPAL